MRQSVTGLDALMRWYDVFSAGDVDAFAELLTADEEAALVIGTDPSQWEAGRRTWVAAYRSQLSQLPGLRLRSGNEPSCFEEGSVAWCADAPSFVLPDGTALPVRLTVVMRREDGAWKLVNAHFSLGVPDDRLGDVLSWAAT